MSNPASTKVGPATRSHYWRGLRNGAPFLVVVPFGMLFGVAATEAGLRLLDVMGFSFLVIAGTAQFAALQLMKTGAPTLIVLATAPPRVWPPQWQRWRGGGGHAQRSVRDLRRRRGPLI